MRTYFILVALVLAGCGKDEPVPLSPSQMQYIGAWQFLSEERSENRLKINNVSLTIYENSTATYRECKVSRTIAKERGGSSSSSSKKVELPDAIITEFTEESINLQQDIGFMNLDYELEINAAPYQHDGKWYLEIENTKLEKLPGDLAGAATGWYCPESEKKDD